MASVTTVVPFGATSHWCSLPALGFNLTQEIPKCTSNTTEYQSICCNGDIIDSAAVIFGRRSLPAVDLKDLVCCGISGTQDFHQNGSDFLGVTTCARGTPTPLASLAATNVEKASLYTYTLTDLPTGYSFENDGVVAATPYCMWFNTVSGVTTSTVTVSAVAEATHASSTTSPGASNTAAASQSITSMSQSSTQTAAAASSTTSQSNAGMSITKASSSLPQWLWKTGVLLGLLGSSITLLNL